MALKVVYVPIETVHPYQGNVKKHPQSQIDGIKKSIKQYGFNDPLAIDNDGTIIEGHGRYEALKELGYTKIPVIRLGNLTKEQRKEYTLVHNKLTMSTGFDLKALRKELAGMANFDFKGYKFDIKPSAFYAEGTEYKVENILNQGIAKFPGVGPFDIPEIRPVVKMPKVSEWIGFNYVLSEQDPKNKGVHFFIHDYQFERIWERPDNYIEPLKKFKCVLSPDFSPYSDMPLAAQLWNHYRKHWLAAYWQSKGITVIPTIRSSADPRSLGWYLSGEPVGGIVSYSSMWYGGADSQMLEMFSKEWSNMIRTLKPLEVIVYGEIVPMMDGQKVTRIPKFTEKRWGK